MKKTIFMIAFLIGLTFSFTYGNNYTPIYNDVFDAHNVPTENTIMEPELELEDWMLELLMIYPTTEQELELEEWMINMDEFYNPARTSEEQLELEDWMFEFPIKKEAEEQKPELENWMFYFS